MANKKELFVFAGANGSGKSTIARDFHRLGLCSPLFICPDQIVSPDKRNDYDSYLGAMQYAETLRIGAIPSPLKLFYPHSTNWTSSDTQSQKGTRLRRSTS